MALRWREPRKTRRSRNIGLTASRLHLIPALCLHAWSATLRLHTLSLRFVGSESASECSGSPFASDAPWSPRSPRFCGNFPQPSPPVNPQRPRQPPAELVNDSIGTAYCILHTAYCILHTAYCILPLSPLPAPLCLRERFLLTPLPTATAYCHSPVSCLLSHVSACTEAPRPPRRHKLTVQHPKGRAGRPRHAATRRDRRAANREKAPTARPIPA